MTWVGPDDSEAHTLVLAVHGRKLALCSGCDGEQQVVEVIVTEAQPGREPRARTAGGEYVTARLRVPLEIRHSPDAARGGWIYWTDDGWVDERSEPVDAPRPEELGRA